MSSNTATLKGLVGGNLEGSFNVTTFYKKLFELPCQYLGKP